MRLKLAQTEQGDGYGLSLLAKVEPDRNLYLAVPSYSYEGIFKEPIGQLMVNQEQLHLIVFDERKERIIQWIS